MIKDIAASDKGKQNIVFQSYFVSAFFVWLVGFVIVLLVKRTWWNDNEMISYSAFMALFMIMINFSISYLQTAKKSHLSLILSLCLILMLFLVCVLPAKYGFNYFLQFYIFSYAILSIFSFVFLKKQKMISLTNESYKNWFLKWDTYKNSGVILIPNLVWMLGIFVFHWYVSNNENTKEAYVYFAIGYQLLTLLVFIPGVLSPIVVPAVVHDEISFLRIIGVSVFYLFCGLVFSTVFIIFTDIFISIYGIDIFGENKTILLSVLISGAVAAGNAPLIQYMVGKGFAIYVVFSSVLWVLVAVLPLFLLNVEQFFYILFLLAYLVSYLVLIVSSLITSFRCFGYKEMTR